MSQLLEQLLCHSTLNANNNTNTLTTSWQEHFYLLYTVPIKLYTNKVKTGKKGRGNVHVSSDMKFKNFFFINEIPGELLHENIVKITCYPHTPVLEKITVALAT